MKTITVTKDFTRDVNEIIKSFKSDEVVVGIPEVNTYRKENEPINNATILAINEFGSPMNNIPARPVMAIGIKNAQEEIADQFKKAMQDAFKKGLPALSMYYNRIGIIASNSVKKVINSQEGIEPPAQSTIDARKAKGFKGTKALLVTAQLRNAITYIVRGEK